MSGMAYRGTSSDQDGKFGNADMKLMAKMQKAGKFSKVVVENKVDTNRVNKAYVEKWVTDKLEEVLGFEDDIVTSMVLNVLFDNMGPDQSSKEENIVCGKSLQMQVTSYLNAHSKAFIEELWKLCLDGTF